MTVDQLKNQIDIYELISEYAAIDENNMCKCPIHNDHDKALKIYRDDNTFFCHSCKVGTSVVDFIKAVENLDFKDAILYLADKYGLEVEGYEEETHSERFQSIIDDNPLTDEHRQYLIQKRGYSENIIEMFNMFSFGVKAPFFMPEVRQFYKDAGIIRESKKKHGVYNWFLWNRISFPLVNRFDNIVAFAGRAIDNKRAKYLNTPNWEQFKKGSFLYNINRALKVAKKKKEIYIVEGYADVWAMVNLGISNVVATCGTSFTGEHQNLIKGVDRKIFMFDGDMAGQKASLSIADADDNTYFIKLPKKHDPDSFIKKFPEEKVLEYFLTKRISYSSIVEKLEDSQERILYQCKRIMAFSDPLKADLAIAQLAEKENIKVETINRIILSLRSKRDANIEQVFTFKRRDKKII